MGTYIKDLIKGNPQAAKKYAQYRVDLPPGANAAGIRPGICNTLDCVVPVELIAHYTGHSLEKFTSMYDYVDADLSKCLQCATVITGWPAPPLSDRRK